MRFEGGRYICAQCGVVLDIAASSRTRVSISAASGMPNVRIISVKGEEIHRCVPVGPWDNRQAES